MSSLLGYVMGLRIPYRVRSQTQDKNGLRKRLNSMNVLSNWCCRSKKPCTIIVDENMPSEQLVTRISQGPVLQSNQGPDGYSDPEECRRSILPLSHNTRCDARKDTVCCMD